MKQELLICWTTNSYANQFIELLEELKKGQHKELLYSEGICKKKELRIYLNIKNAAKFNNKVLSKERVIAYCNKNGIKLSGQYVKFGLRATS